MTAIKTFFATTPKGMEYLLTDELEALGASEVRQTLAGASFEGTLEMGYRVCLWSRIANRVLMPLKTFMADSPEALYQEVGTIDWSEHLDPDGSLAVDFSASNSKITHSHYGALKVKDAVVDQFRAKFGERPSVVLDRPDIRLNVYMTHDEATLSLDFSGESLHRRGYRQVGGKAPLKENLAAAILIRAGWPEIAKAGGGLMDPMCGSGTLMIEGAMIAGDMAPGLMREYFGFFKWKQHEPEVWENLIIEAEKREQEGMDNIPPIVGYDSDPMAIATALGNLECINLRGTVHFEKRELADCEAHTQMRKQPGLFVINPPYGERLGEVMELKPLYANLGQVLKKEFMGWKATVFTGNEDLGKCMGLRAVKRFKMFNGAIPCKLLKFEVESKWFVEGEHQLFKKGPHLNIIAADQVRPEALMFTNRLKKNLKKLKAWKKKENISCLRVYDQDLPEYAVAVDLYDQWVHVQEYEAPKTIDSKKAEERLQDVMALLPEALQVPKDQIYLKVRKKQKGKEQYYQFEKDQKFCGTRPRLVRVC
ncbi:MAG: bifunctional 23S rRNA (guanine(2069)-N(7))-methyltransferase RlmK/23S rRNA (guanine(2445)-N(2))-methyltransferase RlmL [SAR324 cluster bacterium]|uniref:Bifunctional 23S rRNA (Guanine(2069)-N(7))-methyltransferase RlmK/23S rRNA (Guanine(2445)-N(2))-methyltransferase RlmL n=1 Tax=SAR324 cluster bacterium TaxID=2024889 RepID=A0A2A4SZT1_9DELT|nr:MAG: bifunctional 23S rRNA (guanine(2069)-N(7))-methyltransferase RlmK/23S rRNA (guanine(2445)-N(2))-methyltransferase RlmL [SAR324 cluster bacterium]